MRMVSRDWMGWEIFVCFRGRQRGLWVPWGLGGVSHIELGMVGVLGKEDSRNGLVGFGDGGVTDGTV